MRNNREYLYSLIAAALQMLVNDKANTAVEKPSRHHLN